MFKQVKTTHKEKDGWKYKIKETKETRDIHEIRKEVIGLIKEFHLEGLKFIEQYNKERGSSE